jgi:PAS domain S-box-containing protein
VLRNFSSFICQCFRSSLGRKIAFYVFASIIVIEIILLVPSYIKMEKDLLRDREHEGRALILGATADRNKHENELKDRIWSLLAVPGIVGVGLLEGDTEPYSVGEKSFISGRFPEGSTTVRWRSDDGRRYEVAWPIQKGWRFSGIVLNMDTSDVADELIAYVMRIAGMVVIISLFVTMVTMIVLSQLVLTPLLRLRHQLQQAGTSRDLIDITDRSLARKDELGDVFRSVRDLLREISSSIQEIEILARFPAENPNPVLRCSFMGEILYANEPVTTEPGFYDDESREYVAPFLRSAIDKAVISETANDTEMKVGEKILSLTISPVHQSGYVNIYCRDVTALRAAESRLVSLNTELEERVHNRTKELEDQKYALDQHAIVSIADVQGNITYANDKFSQISGYKSEELYGQNHRVLKSGTHPPEFFTNMWKTISGGNVWKGEIKNRAKDGTIYWVDSTITPLLGKDGKPDHYISIRTDITDRKKGELALIEARDSAEVANQVKSEFLATMSHEIRTPMNGVIGMTGLLLDTSLSPEQRHFADTIRGSGEALLSVINDILDFSKMEAGQLELETYDFDLLDLVEGVADLLAPRVYEKDLEISYYVPPSLQGSFTGDPGRLRQVLINLLGNGIKFTEQGTVSVLVSEAASNNRVRFEVHDTGIGIPDDALKNLFMSFSQLDASTARRYGGTGLGLAISKQIVMLMGGEIGVESKPGEGSLFWFEIPLPAGSGTGQNKPAQHRDAYSEISVLVVDDNPVNREIFKRTLTNWNFSVQTVDSAASGLAAMEDNNFQVVLTDLKMPVETGADFVRAVRQRSEWDAVKLIMASSVQKEEIRKEIDLDMVDHCLLKPVRQSILYNTLLDVLNFDKPTIVSPNSKGGTSDNPTEEETPPENRLRILVAEDNPINQKVAVGLLEKLGHRVDVAANGAEAVKAVQSLPYDLAFMDMQMPEMDGLQATRIIRSLPGKERKIPIIAMTANAMKGDREKCLAAGMDDYLSKPVDKKKLITALNARLETGGSGNGNDGPAIQATEIRPAPEELIDMSIIQGLIDDLDKNEISDLVATYIENTQIQIRNIEDAISSADMETLEKAAHNLKGMSSTLGITATFTPAMGLEDIAPNNPERDELDINLSKLKDSFEKAKSALEQEFPEILS